LTRRLRQVAALVGLAAAAFSPAPAPAQSAAEVDALRKEVEALKAGQERLEKDIEEIRNLLFERQAAPLRDVVVSVAGSPFKGERGAQVTLVEFSDYQCPFCARHARETLPLLERDYIGTGKVQYVFRDFPIASAHPQAPKAHEAARCAGEQGRYWEMHARLFGAPNALAPADLRRHAKAVALEAERFEQCLDGGAQAARVRQDVAEGRRASVKGTPTFFLGLTGGDEPTVKATRIIRGAQPYSVFKEAIELLLSSAR
jgi:protein-disulfide isomerase